MADLADFSRWYSLHQSSVLYDITFPPAVTNLVEAQMDNFSPTPPSSSPKPLCRFPNRTAAHGVPQGSMLGPVSAFMNHKIPPLPFLLSSYLVWVTALL